MDKDRIKSLIYDYFRETLEVDEESRLEKTRPFTSEEYEGQYLGCSNTFDKVGDEIACVDLRRVSPQVIEFLNNKGITDIPADSLAFKILALELLKAQYTILQIIAARTDGNIKREGELRKEYVETVLCGVEVIAPKADQDQKKT